MDRTDDLEVATRLTQAGPAEWRGRFREEWGLWGPAGGHVTALALRAAGEATDQARPVSMTCHFVRVGKFDDVNIHVESLKKGRRNELLRVDLKQDDKLIFTAQFWAMPDELPGIAHDATELSSLPDPSTLPTWQELFPNDPQPDFFTRIDQRPIKRMSNPGEPARDPELTDRKSVV